MKKAGIYARVSTTAQFDGDAINRQIEESYRYAEGCGYVVSEDHIVAEQTATETIAEQVELQALVQAAKDGAIGVIAALSPDTLSRDWWGVIETAKELYEYGATFLFVGGRKP